MSSHQFEPATIVITGVTRGLGRAMVEEFTRLGHRVLGCGRTKPAIQELVRLYPGSDFRTVDVSCDTEVRAWAEGILKGYGAPDFVLNNAAVINLKASLWKVENCDFSREVDINIKGVVNVIRHFVPAMIKRKRGVIVNFSSRWGRKSERQMAPYCATKWAIVGLTGALAAELKPEGIVAVSLNPGIVNTEMLQKYLGNSSPLGTRYPTADEWARVAVPFILRLRLKDTGRFRNVPSPLACADHH